MSSDPTPNERPVLLTDAERAQLARDRAVFTSLYERLIVPLTAAQTQSEAHLKAAAASYRAITAAFQALAAEFATLAEVAAGLAESVPSGDQAAADLGTAAEHHDYAGLRMVVEGEQALAQRLEARLDALSGDVAALTRIVRTMEATAQAQRTLMLQALGVTGGGDA